MKKIIQLLKYGFWGGVTTMINLALFYLLIKVNINYLIANVVSYFIAIILSYYLNNKYVFEQEKQSSESLKFIKFCIVRICSIVADTLILALMVSMLKLNIWYSKVFVSFVIILITYILNKHFVFSSKNKNKGNDSI